MKVLEYMMMAVIIVGQVAKDENGNELFFAAGVPQPEPTEQDT